MIFMVLLSLDVIAHSNIFGWRRRTINVINYYYYYYYYYVLMEVAFTHEQRPPPTIMKLQACNL